ncbi:hypothetical protein ACFXA3_23040 [Streptomyces sp. NPDC059456]
MVRVNHYGQAATLPSVLGSLTALSAALPSAPDPAAALSAAESAWTEALH